VHCLQRFEQGCSRRRDDTSTDNGRRPAGRHGEARAVPRGVRAAIYVIVYSFYATNRCLPC